MFVPLVAAADPDSASLYGHAGIGLGSFAPSGRATGIFAYDVAAAVRLGDVWIRGALTVAELGFGSSDKQYEPHAGVEWRSHDRPTAAAFAGLEVGWARGDGYVEDGQRFLSAPFVMPRGGIEIGGEHVRVQLTLELMLGYGRLRDTSYTPVIDEQATMKGANLALGIIVR